MFDLEDDDRDTFSPTVLDKLRLEDMEIGDKIEAESGAWTVFLYRDGYSLISNKIRMPLTFKKLNDLITYLNNKK